ncbi:MAG: hypothetical protein KC415_21510, partial [Anaerolineales bacterium]|nr:hypothetical protein [Anaerolineales bacterium]
VETIRLIQSALGNVQMSGTAVIFLHEDGGQRSVVVLAASADGLQNTVDRVLDLIPLNADYALSDCLVQDNLALCPTNVSNEEVEAELLSGGEPSEAVTPDEEPTGDGEPDDTGIGDTGGGFETTLDAVPQGSIGLDETVDGTLGPDESHAWTFSDGPATIDIVMSSEVLDGVLELYDPDNVWLDSSDSGYSGDGEALYAIDIPDDGVYTIVVRDYWGDEGDYSLSVTAVAPPDQTGDSGDTGDTTTADIGNIFIFVDDDGEPLDGGITSGAEMADILGQEHIVILWTTSIDGPLQEDTLDGTDLLIWDTGDYLDSEGFYDPDTEIIVNYLDGGAGSLLMVGSAPLFFNYFDLASLADLEVGADDPILLDGFASGDVITLDQPYQTIASEFLGDDLTDEDIVMFNRGPESEQAGTIAAVATVDSLGTDQRAVVLLFPFTALPMAVQEPLLTNLINWFAQ